MSEVATATPEPTTWQAKHKDALAKLSQLREEAKAGIPDGEAADAFHKKMADAFAEANQVKAQKNAAELDSKFAELDRLGKMAEVDERTGELKDLATKSIAERQHTEDDPTTKAAKPNAMKIAMGEMAVKRLGSIATKALNEGTAGAGGYLVPPMYAQDLFSETRRQGNSLRKYGWLNEHPVETNLIYIPRGAGTGSVGWVSENAIKPSSDQSYTQLAINIFTLAGISKVSLQLVNDSNPTAADLVLRELGGLIGNAEEQAIISGTGSGQPKGILNATGLASNVTNDASTTAQGAIDAIIVAAAAVVTNYFQAPTGALMHPKRLSYIMRGKDTTTNYLFNAPGTFRQPGVPGGGNFNDFSAWDSNNMAAVAGLPIGVSADIPTNLGGGTNQDAIIVANWSEAHWFQRQDLTLDASDVAGTSFEANQVWYRLEERAGFTAERNATAFAVVTGSGSAWTA